ncbi:MED14-domain-containing protein [Dentipellis sp. KUC8613]|nr:MED14-domain-containing protein [Dentipellis sp. KUC8613]
MALNGTNLTASTSQQPSPSSGFLDGMAARVNGFEEPPIEILERELPLVYDGQIPLREVVTRVVQACYAEMTEMSETLPSMSDSARKRKLADFVVFWKKQIAKVYAVAKWSRDADIVQKCMNITAFLMNQNRQFDEVIHGLKYAKDSLDPARLRNHDLLTSLDVLTTGSYRRLPTGIKKSVIPPTPLTDEEVAKTLSDIEILIRYRLRMKEIIPPEMAHYRISDGRVFFTVPKLFEASLCLRGGEKDDGWFFVHVEFLFNVGGDLTGVQEFPRKPDGILKRHITDEADARLAFYLPLPQDQPVAPGIEPPPRPQLPEGVVDAPLVRLYNFLQMMSMSYQLEILWFQAQRLRSLGWADYLTVEMSRDRKTLTVSYWIRKPPPRTNARFKLPLLGGTLSIALVPSPGPRRSPRSRVLAELQERAKLPGRRPSDTVEGMSWNIEWAPAAGALGVKIAPEDAVLAPGEVVVDADDLDLERLLRVVIEKHTFGIFKVYLRQLQHSAVFSSPDSVALMKSSGSTALQAHLCADEIVTVTIDARTGRLNLRDTGELGSASRAPRFAAINEKLNENPGMLLEALVRLRMNTIIELAEQKANYLGFQTYRQRNFSREEFQKLGPLARSLLYIQLSPFPNHYLVLVVTDEDFRYALISVTVVPESLYQSLVMEDIGWLDVAQICGHGGELEPGAPREAVKVNDLGLAGQDRTSAKFKLETQVLRELYAYCCARVAHTKVEKQFKARGIPYTHVSPSSPMHGPALPSALSHLHSGLSQTIPGLCVQSSDILAGSPAFEAAMPNIRVIPLSWWSGGAPVPAPVLGEGAPQVVTCVKLKYVQQPVGRRAGGAGAVIRPSKRIVYDASEAVVCFLAEDVESCVNEFLEEWASVSKIVVIAREVAKMAKERQWHDVRLLSFDLQTVEFAYASDYTVSIKCTDQLHHLHAGSYSLRFSRLAPGQQRPYNPHTEAEPFLCALLRQGRLPTTLPALVAVLRDTVPVLELLEAIRRQAPASDEDADGDVRMITDAEGAGKDTQGSAGRCPWPVDVFPKAAGWWRVLFGPGARHALDVRLMAGRRVAVLDGAHSLFLPSSASSASSNSSTSASTSTALVSSSSAGASSTAAAADEASLLLRPIPHLKDALRDAVKAAGAGGRGRVAAVAVGVVCDVGDVRAVGGKVWEGVVRLVSGASNGGGSGAISGGASTSTGASGGGGAGAGVIGAAGVVVKTEG